MPIEAIKIPQNVYIEDRIVGPLTLKQILIVGAGAGFSYALYGMLTKTYGALPLPITIVAWIPAGIAAIFAFIRINDVSMFRLLLLAVEHVNKPSTRVWTPRRGITINIRTFTAPEADKKNMTDTRASSDTTQLEELSAILDRPAKPHLETIDTVDMVEETPQQPVTAEPIPDELDIAEPATLRPVNPSRVTVSTPLASIFRDISPTPNHG